MAAFPKATGSCVEVVPVGALRREPFVLWPRWRSHALYDEIFSSGSPGFSPRCALR